MADLSTPAIVSSERVCVRAADRELELDDLAYLNRMTTTGHVLPTVAHELNNALQIISGAVEVLSLKQDLAPDVRDKIARIGTQAGRATDMIRDLVGFVRRDDGGVKLVDVGKVVEGALAFRRYQLSRARIGVAVEGTQAGQCFARLDRGHLHQILLNLIINAEHSLAGRPDGRLQVRCARAGDVVEVAVSDNGPGVPDDLVGRLTEPFFTTKVPAAGLGLTVAVALAKEVGGDLRLTPDAAGGAVATLSIPAADTRRD
ncbi:MAG: sensor histidine kinase [Vicinamibacterales bacterium]